MVCVFLLSPVSLHGQDLSDPDKDVQCVDVDSDRVVDGIVRLELLPTPSCTTGVVLGPVNDLLGVVEDESSKEDEAAVEGQGVDTRTQGSGGREKVGGDA